MENNGHYINSEISNKLYTNTHTHTAKPAMYLSVMQTLICLHYDSPLITGITIQIALLS